MPMWASWLVVGAAVLSLLHIAISCWVGLHDVVPTSDVAIVFGNTVEPSGRPSPRLRARLDRAWELQRAGLVKAIIVSGGLGSEGHQEADVMRACLLDRARSSGTITENDDESRVAAAIVVDRRGSNTRATLRNAREIMTSHGWRSAILVTSYHHLARARLCAWQEGVPTAGWAHARHVELRDGRAVVRELVAFYWYLIR